MLKILIPIIFTLTSCSQDNEPKFDCKKAELEMNRAHDKWQYVVKVHTQIVRTPAGEAEWLAEYNRTKNLYIEAAKTYNSNCK